MRRTKPPLQASSHRPCPVGGHLRRDAAGCRLRGRGSRARVEARCLPILGAWRWAQPNSCGRSEAWFRPGAKQAVLIAVALLALGCAGAKVAVPTTQFPTPLVAKVPLPVGLYLDEALLSYIHQESREQQGDWEIELGSAQPAMFTSLLNGMFIGHRRLERLGGSHGDIAGVLAPTIEEIQFTTPEQTRTDYYEVWMRYRFDLHSNQGAKLGDWKLSAYGKSHKQNHSGASSALQEAALSACRDAMAFFTQQFSTVPAVQAWLQQEGILNARNDPSATSKART